MRDDSRSLIDVLRFVLLVLERWRASGLANRRDLRKSKGKLLKR